MNTQIIDYQTYVKEKAIDKFVEYLFSSEPILETEKMTVPIKGKKVDFKDDKKKELKEKLKKIKRHRDFAMDDDGGLGISLYIRILKSNKVHILIRVSYHSPTENFGSWKTDRDAIGYLCIDALSIEDQNKVLKIRKDKKSYQNSGIPKEEHKRTVAELGLSNSKYVDLGTDEYSKIIDEIKSFLGSLNLKLYENEDLEKFDIFCDIEWDE